VFGGYPQYDENAYFIQVNCELTNPNPEVCQPNTPLTWNHNAEALKVYAVHGTSSGANTFNLNDWKTGTGGRWQHWSVVNGIFNSVDGSAIDCASASLTNQEISPLLIYPNPFEDIVSIENSNSSIRKIRVLQIDGRELQINTSNLNTALVQIELRDIPKGVYWIEVQHHNGSTQAQMIVKQ